MGFNTVFYVLLAAGFSLLQIDWTSGLECYHCADTGGKSDCQDYKALIKSNDKEGGLKRECPNNTLYCMTEKFVKQGVIYSFIRDCTNNTKDSYSFPKTGRLKNLKPDNNTVCTFKVKSMGQECISLCHKDLCNGPAGADSLIVSGKLLVFTLLWWCICFY